MATDLPVVTISAIVAFFETAPQRGGEYLVAAAENLTSGTVTALDLETPDLRDRKSLARSPHWSQLAAILVEIPRSATSQSMLDDRSFRIELRDNSSHALVAAGLAIFREPSTRFAESEEVTPGLTVWLTGLSGAGKTTIACELERILRRFRRVEMLDADMVRTHICKGLGFTEEDRRENVRRLALLAKMLAESGSVVLVCAIAPYRTARSQARCMLGRFIEVFVNAPLSVCERRDVKGLYKKARNGEIKRFTGIDDPYEPPIDPEVECRTDVETVEESVAKVMAALVKEANLSLTSENGPT
jgi:adenylylsulfate kinase